MTHRNVVSKLASRPLRLCLTPLVLCVSLACASNPGGQPEDAGGAGGSQSGSASGGARAGGGGEGAGGGSAGSTSQGGTSAAGSATEGGGGAGGGSGGGSEGSDGPQEHGFTLRRPGDTDLDWLCTFGGASAPGYAYVRLQQTGTKQTGLAQTPVYQVELAQVSIAGVVSSVQNAQYDYGGGHHNDSLRFDYERQSHTYYHSSFGFGWRACQPMDCRNVSEPGSTTPATEGCGAARTLPEVCVSIDGDGTHGPLTDSFMKCAGDQT